MCPWNTGPEFVSVWLELDFTLDDYHRHHEPDYDAPDHYHASYDHGSYACADR